MTVETEDDLDGLRRIGQIVARALSEMLGAVRPGITTAELDAIGERYLKKYGARSAPQLDAGFPKATCISVNEEIAHGIPGPRVIKEGDIVNVDVSAELGGYYADNAATQIVGAGTAQHQRLCHSTHAALQSALTVARADAPLNLIGRELEKHARRSGFRVVRNLCSHGVGRALHEAPKSIPSFFAPQDLRRLKRGDVITIEPFFSTGLNWVDVADDGWTLLNSPQGRSAQFEHTIVITHSRPLVMTLP